MYIVDVIPLIRTQLATPQLLSYFTTTQLPHGALVRVMVGKRDIPALVAQTENIAQRKLQLKAEEFQLKKLDVVISPTPVVNATQYELAKKLSDAYLVPLGMVLRQMVPHNLLTRKTKLKTSFDCTAAPPTEPTPTPVYMWGSNPRDALLSRITQTVKRGETCLLLVPHTAEVKKWKAFLQRHIAKETIHTFTGTRSQKKEEVLREQLQHNTGHVLIATRAALFLPFANLGLVVVTSEAHQAYKAWGASPKLHARDVARHVATVHGAHYILQDTLPSLAAFRAIQDNTYETVRLEESTQPATPIVINLKTAARDTAITPQLKEHVTATLEKRGRIVLFVNRRGSAAALVCQECGEAVQCKKCKVPYVYHTNAPTPFLLCHHCGTKEQAPTQCPKCSNSSFRHVGHGTQRVAEELMQTFSKAAILRLDSDSCPTVAAQKKVLDVFEKESGTILVATTLLNTYMNRLSEIQPELISVVYADALLSFPEYRAHEMAFRQLSQLQQLAPNFCVQTYTPEHELFSYLAKNPEDFFQHELDQRKSFNYPPYTQLIHIVARHKQPERTRQTLEQLAKQLADTMPKDALFGPIENYTPWQAGWYHMHLLIKRAECDDIKEAVRQHVPHGATVTVNPTSLL